MRQRRPERPVRSTEDRHGLKVSLRQEFLKRRLGLGAAREAYGARIGAALVGHAVFAKAECVLVYIAFRGEVPTGAIISAALASGKVVAAPLTVPAEPKLIPLALSGSAGELRPGAFGILEPDPDRCPALDPSSLDLVVVPGLAFDLDGGRLGYGGGFYDRFLGREAPKAVRAGLAFEVQIAGRPLPLGPYDVPMDLVFTEQRILQGERKSWERSCHDS